MSLRGKELSLLLYLVFTGIVIDIRFFIAFLSIVVLEFNSQSIYAGVSANREKLVLTGFRAMPLHS